MARRGDLKQIPVRLDELVDQKEKEWKEAQGLRVKSLEAGLKEKDNLLNNEKLRFMKLKEDFEYNLKLLQERDQELEKYDAVFSEFKNIGSARDGEVSELKIKLADLQAKVKEGIQEKEELQRHYQQRVHEHKQELQQFRLGKDSEVKRDRDELERFKRELQNQLRAAEEDIETQRQTLISDFDDALHKREHEFRIKADEMSSNLLASNLKVKMLSKEVELLRAHEERTRTELQTTETSAEDLVKNLKQKEWELMDERNMNNAKQADVELEIGQLKASMKKMQEIFQHKQAELDRYAREKEAGLLSAKEGHQVRERKLEETIRELQTGLDTAEVECRRMEWDHKDTLKDKELKIQRLEAKVAELNEKLDSQAAEFSRSAVARDLELEALRQQEEKLRIDVAQRNEDLERYKKELSLASERESSLERAKSQMELDWQRRCEDSERVTYSRQEELIKNLTRTRDEAVATSKEKDRELKQREDLIRILTETRDQAHATLQRHGLSVPSQLPSKEGTGDAANDPVSSGGDIASLQEQNKNLREVIRQMRRDMEELNEQLVSRPPSVMVPPREFNESGPLPLTTEYVTSLETEIREIKAKNRSLSQRLEELPLTHKPPLSQESGARRLLGKIDDPFVQSHVKELNDTIGALRNEKLQIAAEAKKHEATTSHLRHLVNQAQDQVRQKQVAIDQTQYELSTLTRRSADETNTQKQRIAELELQLAQVRREADEYYKSGLERNLEATNLGNQLSVLKMELASQGRSTTSFNPQSAVVHQLQDEINRLRQKQGHGPISRPHTDTNVARLQGKLKVAAQHIAQLAREKEQLIQMGNRLRAEVARLKGSSGDVKSPPSPPPGASPRSPVAHGQRQITANQMADNVQTQLSAMERLQYALTTHELQVAQRMAEQQRAAAGHAKVTMGSSSSDTSVSDSYEPTRPMDSKPEPSSHRLPHMQAPTSSRRMRTEDYPSADKQDLEPRVPPEPTLLQSSQRTSSPLNHAFMTSSSEGQVSLQEIWKLLDEEESFRSLSPVKERPHTSPSQSISTRNQAPDHIPVREESGSNGFTVKGKRTDMDRRTPAEKPELSRKAMGKVKATPKKSGKVRNYNVRNDKHWRGPNR